MGNKNKFNKKQKNSKHLISKNGNSFEELKQLLFDGTDIIICIQEFKNNIAKFKNFASRMTYFADNEIYTSNLFSLKDYKNNDFNFGDKKVVNRKKSQDGEILDENNIKKEEFSIFKKYWFEHLNMFAIIENISTDGLISHLEKFERDAKFVSKMSKKFNC